MPFASPLAAPARRRLRICAAAALLALPAGLAACGRSSEAASSAGVISVVAAENQYGDVASQIGGPYVHVTSIESNPNSDPHSYEVSPSVARQVSAASLLIENGIGYDAFMDKLASATHRPGRKVINVQRLLGLPDSTSNPHLWYDPKTMPAVAEAVAKDLSTLDPAHAQAFRANAAKFDLSLKPWLQAVASFKAQSGGTAVATTEPVADYLLQAMGLVNLAPARFQADIMNGSEPAPQDIALENSLLSGHKVKAFAYNEQVVDSLTESIRSNAQKYGVPIVAVYETMPAPGYNYQSWMLAETQALRAAVLSGTSTLHL